MDKEMIVNNLRLDLKKNINLLNFIAYNPIDLVAEYNGRYIIRGLSDDYWVYNTAKTPTEFLELLRNTPDDKCFVVQSSWEVEVLKQWGNKIDFILPCKKLFIPDSIVLPTISKHITTKLKATDSDYLYANSKYSDISNTQYILDRIEKDTSSCIYDDDKIVGWCMTHDDGSIGFLNVLESHWRKGMAQSLMIDMINKIRNQGKLPFVHVEESNIPSMSLMKRLGFIEYGDIYWIKFK